MWALIISGVTVVFASLWARELGVKRVYLVPICLWFQPWFSQFAFTANTMVPFGLLLVMGIFYFLKGKFCTTGLIAGLLPLTRHEGVALTAILVILFLW